MTYDEHAIYVLVACITGLGLLLSMVSLTVVELRKLGTPGASEGE